MSVPQYTGPGTQAEFEGREVAGSEFLGLNLRHRYFARLAGRATAQTFWGPLRLS